MLVAFCLRLGWGLIVGTLLVPAAIVPPRFFRVQYLVSLGLLAVAGFFLRDLAGVECWIAMAAAMVLTFAGSVIWHVEGSPGQRPLGWLTALAMTAALLTGGAAARGTGLDYWNTGDDLAGAAVLGAATSAMLMGHSYLIAPAMSMTPLFRLLIALGIALIARAGLALCGLWLWTTSSADVTLKGDLLFWLPVRWVLGLAGPLILGWMAWETARIRSTQSATGILYVVTIICFLGELTSQLLVARTGFVL